MTTLLFPTDFSVNSSAALDWSRLFARKTGATILLLHAYLPILPDTTLPTVGDPGMGLVASQEIEDISRQRLDTLAAELEAEGLSVRTEWRIGSAEDEILAVARESSVDLIVMGRSDLSTFFDRLAGSAVTDVADGSRCPVLIVPTPAEGVVVQPAQIHTIAYAMQTPTTQSDVSAQTDSLLEAFDAKLTILTDDQLDDIQADMVVMQLYPKAGFLDELLHPNPVTGLVKKATVPLLIYHTPE